MFVYILKNISNSQDLIAKISTLVNEYKYGY